MFVGSSKKENGWHWKAGRGGRREEGRGKASHGNTLKVFYGKRQLRV